LQCFGRGDIPIPSRLPMPSSLYQKPCHVAFLRQGFDIY
jgi:hypothetical protein